MRELLTTIALLLIFHSSCFSGSNPEKGYLKGNIILTDSWEKIIYVSHIPTFEDMYSMSNKMIISQSPIDSLGNFSLNLDFLPLGINLFRLHVTKKGDSPNSIIIGGNDENHLFFLANRIAQIELIANSGQPPFRNIRFSKSLINRDFQKITNMTFQADSIASESSAAKRNFIEEKLNEELLIIADTSSIAMVSLYAIYLSDFETKLSEKIDFFTNYENKWKSEQSLYFKAFNSKLPQVKSNNRTIQTGLLVVIALVLGFSLGKIKFGHKKTVKRLSIQEKRVFELLKKGATNQEISEEFNIGISTVKSHVSSILSKLKMKSRKEAMQMD